MTRPIFFAASFLFGQKTASDSLEPAPVQPAESAPESESAKQSISIFSLQDYAFWVKYSKQDRRK